MPKAKKKLKVKMQTAAIVQVAPPSHWRNMATSLQRIALGDIIPVQVQGGWVRKAAPCSGMLVHVAGSVDCRADDTAIFIPDLLPT